jgi:BirA family biotin operon repressor/biotin-[acetyl-CoA-carboxylase] ligase
MKNNALTYPYEKSGCEPIISTDRLKAEDVLARLSYKAEVFCHECIGSTNDEAKRLASDGCGHGTLVIAESQSAGRGRHGRRFFSPHGSGLYLSVVLRPDGERDGTLYTVAAAVAVRRVLSEYDREVSIKWVNDVYLRERKVAGILCEAASELESGRINAVICGIGVNLNSPKGGFPEDIKNKAGYLTNGSIDRAELSAKIADTLLEVLKADNESLISEYSEHMMLTGRLIYYTKNGEKHSGTVEGVDPTGGLVVVEDNGSRSALTSGEVQLEAF